MSELLSEAQLNLQPLIMDGEDALVSEGTGAIRAYQAMLYGLQKSDLSIRAIWKKLQDGGDEDEAIAALLHDALEDKPEETNRNEITELFGERVVAIIEVSIDTPPEYKGGVKPPWRQRKESYLAHIRSVEPAFLRVTVADKLDNVRSILADYARVGDTLWERFNAGREDQLWYYESAVQAYEEAGFRGLLLDELKAWWPK